MSIIVDIVCVVRPGKQMKGGALVNCNLLDVVSGDLYIYCMALFIDVKLMIDDDDDESFKFWGSKDLCQNTKI